MAISTPTSILAPWYADDNSPATTLGTTTSSPAGALIVLSLAWYNNTSMTSVVDSAGNHYTLAESSAYDSYGLFSTLWYCSNALALPSGGTFTLTGGFTAATGGLDSNGAWYVTGANGGLGNTATYSATNTKIPSGDLSTGTLAAGGQILFGFVCSSQQGGGAYTEDTTDGWTSLNPYSGPVAAAYQTVSSTTSVGWASTWVTSTDFAAVLATFKISPVLPLAPRRLVYRRTFL